MENIERKTIPPLETITANTLINTEYPPLQFAIEQILPQGIFILAGSGKIGKSWLILDMCVSVATGATFWNYGTTSGEVLCLALEDNHRRLQSRLLEINEKIETPKLHFAISSMGISNGLIDQVNDFIEAYPNTKFIVIDTLENIRNTEVETSMYSHDYNDIKALRTITDAHDVTVILVHHTRKMFDPDPLNMLTGSTGLVGAVDGVWVLEKEKRTENKGKLTIANRDTEGYCFKVEFDKDNCKWLNLGNYEEITSDDDSDFCNIINNFVNYRWQGTATELVESITETNISATAITKKLNKNKDILFSVYGIRYDYERTKNKRIITLFREVIMTDDIVDIPTPNEMLQLPQNIIDVEDINTEGCI